MQCKLNGRCPDSGPRPSYIENRDIDFSCIQMTYMYLKHVNVNPILKVKVNVNVK